MSETKPKRVIDRERQWRKIDAGHYVSPKGRFHATRDGDGWMLLDTTGELEPTWFARWRDARARVETVEFAPPELQPIELREEELRDEFHNTVRIRLVRGGETIGDVVVYGPRLGHESTIAAPRSLGAVAPEIAEAFATALMLACHHAARLDREAQT